MGNAGRHRRMLTFALTFAAFLFLPSCAPTATNTPAAAPTTCPPGTQKFFPGCGGGRDFVAGCYASCSPSESESESASPSTCEAGRTCRAVQIDPCVDVGCDACGAEHHLCL